MYDSWTGSFSSLFIFIFILLTAASCTTTEINPPVPAQTALADPTKTEAIDNLSVIPTSTSLPTGIPSPTGTSQTPHLTLGQPVWIGRGKIVDAEFLPGANQVAIAWGSGVSLNRVDSGEELWYRSTPTNLVAFDVNMQGQAFAAALADGTVMVLDASTGSFHLYGEAMSNADRGDVAWSPDGQTVAYQFIGPGRSDLIQLIDVASGQVQEIPNSSTGEGVAPALTWSLDGKSISVAALGSTCPRLIDVHTGEDRLKLVQDGECYTAFPQFLPDQKTLAVSRANAGVDLLHFPDGMRTKTLQPPNGQLLGRLVMFPAAGGSLFAGPTGKWIASRGGYEPCYCSNPEDQPDHPLVAWDLASGMIRAQLKLSLEPLATRHRLAAAFDGERIVILYESGEITRWEFADPQAIEEITARIPVRPVVPFTLAWSADGSRLAYNGEYGGVDVFEPASGRLLRRFDAPLNTPALSTDGGLVALYDPAKNAEVVYQVDDGSLLQNLSASPVLMGASFSPDGQSLAYGEGASAAVVSLASGQSARLTPPPSVPVTKDTSVTRLIWSPNGQALVTVLSSAAPGDTIGAGILVLWKRGEEDRFSAVYHVANGQASFATPNLTLAAFNPSGSRVVLQAMPVFEAGQTRLVVYDLRADQVTQTFPEYRIGAWVDDTELLAAEAQVNVRLTRLNVVSGEKTLGGSHDFGDNAYAPGGIFTAQMAQPDGRGITVTDWRSGEIVARAAFEPLNLTGYSWSPDGSWLAATGGDGTVHIWPVTAH